MRNHTADIPLLKEKKLTNSALKREGARSAKKKWENENWEKGIVVPTFDSRPLRRVKITIEKPQADYCIFKMTDKGSEKMDWSDLADGHKKAFNEVINTFVSKERIPAIAEHFAGGISFAYSDDEVDISAVCVAAEGKLMLFYRELEA